MKRFAALALVFSLFAVSCTAPASPRKNELSVVCTIFPIYDWTRQIIGDVADGVALTLLLNSRADLHSFQPSVDDIIKISACDLFIYNGGFSDIWVEDALREAVNPGMTVINLLDELGAAAKEEELAEGMEEDEEEEDGTEYDEHIWLSLKNAVTLCGVIAGALAGLDKPNAEVYGENYKKYSESLISLDGEYREAAERALYGALLFGDRFPFRYLADDYGLKYFAAFPGCSAETEASFKTIVTLAEKTDEYELAAVLITESSNGSIARAIIDCAENKDLRILTMDSMQSVTPADIAGGATYLSIMEKNLAVLKEALN